MRKVIPGHERYKAPIMKLREKLTQAPVLSHPFFNKPFLLDTNAIEDSIGAVLSQEENDGQVHPLAHTSRAMSPAGLCYTFILSFTGIL